jgi:hypothetical protein
VFVDCWIGVTEESNQRVVRLAGRLTVAQVPDLMTACADAGDLQIDLTDLVSADMFGIEALQNLRDRGATLVGVNGYIQVKLDSRLRPAPPTKARNG